MIIECRECGNSYSPNCLRCPICRQYETPPALHAEFVLINARDWMESPSSRDDFERRLIEGGYTPVEAHEITKKTLAGIRQENRMVGLRALTLAGIVFGLGVFTLPFGLIRTGLGAIALSVPPAMFGLKLLLTGRDDTLVH